jgi:glutathione S-transferase
MCIMRYYLYSLLCWSLLVPSAEAFPGVSFQRGRHVVVTSCRVSVGDEAWYELEEDLSRPYLAHLPHSMDSALDSSTTPEFSTERPTLFRERHGWCPYSERVWLTLELAGIPYDTIRIDNTGGPRPSYFGGQTPQMKWPDHGRPQGESMDLVKEVDRRYANGRFQSDSKNVQEVLSQFSKIFPRARPSSRAAYLFQYNGEPLSKSTFEETLQNTDALLSQTTNGPFFCGSELTAADIAWAPFLERYRYQLPCLHEGLDPANANDYPHLANWYAAMDQTSEYACRVKGDASSWRKVLSMAGFGNACVPSQIQSNMDELVAEEEASAQACMDLDVWTDYAKDRVYVERTPHREAAAIITRNRGAISQDVCKQSKMPNWKGRGLPDSPESAEAALRELVAVLIHEGPLEELAFSADDVSSVATFLDERICVPRDMGAMSAATIKNLAVALRQR